ncbi:LexA family protein [Clostridium sp. Marseille-QA1073]
MELSKKQQQIVNSKFNGCLIIKGEEHRGKTITAIHRAIHLKNNYCLYNDDNIIMIIPNDEEKENILNIYEKEQESGILTLFSYNNQSFKVFTINEIIESKFKQIKSNKSLIDDSIRAEVLKECIIELKKQKKRSKILKEEYISYFLEEFDYIKSNMIFSIDDYQIFIRKGRKDTIYNGPKSVPKNSSTREVIFNLMELYDEVLEERNLIDCIGRETLILRSLKINDIKSYTHIIVDKLHKYSKLQLEIIRLLNNKKDYTNFIVTWDIKDMSEKNSLGNRGIKIKDLFYDMKIKTMVLKEKFKRENKIASFDVSKDYKNKENIFMESYEFFDIRHNRKFDFAIDTSSETDFILNPKGKGENLRIDDLLSVPMYNDIAAGEPIMINEGIEGNFYLPKYWLKGIKDAFLLKVKGDSMINANINDGDYVVIRKQYNANNNDIIAVDLDGSATLKRLSIKKEGIFLMPENDKYTPIVVDNENTTIIGIAIAIIKRN